MGGGHIRRDGADRCGRGGHLVRGGEPIRTCGSVAASLSQLYPLAVAIANTQSISHSGTVGHRHGSGYSDPGEPVPHQLSHGAAAADSCPDAHAVGGGRDPDVRSGPERACDATPLTGR